MGSGNWGMALAGIILRLKEPEAEACCTGSELLASFRPISRHKERICHEPTGRLEWSLSSTHSCRDPLQSWPLSLSPVDARHAGPGARRSGLPTSTGHHPQVTGGQAASGEKTLSPPGRQCPWAGLRERGVVHAARRKAAPGQSTSQA